MFTKLPHFTDSQFEELLQSGDHPEGLSGSMQILAHKDGVNATDYLDKKEVNSLKSRSTKSKAGDFNISFQAEFIDEHISALIYQTKNLVELSLKKQNIITLNQEVRNPFENQGLKIPLNIMENELLAPQARRQFIKDLENEDKLNQFLVRICEEFSAELAHEMVYLVYFFWEKYIQIRKPLLSQSFYLSSALKFCVDLPQLLEKSGISFLNFRAFQSTQLAPEKDLEKNLEEYLAFFGSTVFLIVEGYFENPFTEEQVLKGKRKREEDEDIFGWDQFCESSEEIGGRSPAKRVKFD